MHHLTILGDHHDLLIILVLFRSRLRAGTLEECSKTDNLTLEMNLSWRPGLGKKQCMNYDRVYRNLDAGSTIHNVLYAHR